jgi:S-DNA-T family DNA segregation ATPase FtsK/SpoIIIE
LRIAGSRITILEDRLCIETEDRNVTTDLLELAENKIPFEDFPHYKRSPRIIKKAKEKKIHIEQPKEFSDKNKGGLVQIILPPLIMICITIGISILMKRGLYVILSVVGTGMSLILSITKFVSDRKETKENKILREKTYRAYLLRKRKEIYHAYQEEKNAYLYSYPSMQEIQRMIQSYNPRIYERSYSDEDFLKISLGIARTKPKFQIELSLDELKGKMDQLEEEAKLIKNQFSQIDRPVVIDLKKAHLGLVGEKTVIHEQLKTLIAQLTFFHSYHDIEMIAIFDEKYDDDFQWVRWYPHFKIHMINCVGTINSERKRDQILGSLHQILKERKLKEKESKKESLFLPYFIFIVDEPKWIMDHSIMEYLERDGYNLGFSLIYTTNQRANLPEKIGTIALLENSTDGTLLMEERQEKNLNFKLSSTEGTDLEWMARNLGAVEHMKGISAQIPSSITFFELYEVERPSQLHIEQRWKHNDSSKSLAVPLGARAEGDYVYLNLHEKAHGPHGLVAGTTGSGKSEIIQSYILSLAVNFHPYEVAFLLIDYKGGGMAGLFKNLPHLLGTITNLDGAQSMRAMASIKSELARRQAIFNKYNVNHINSYNQLFKNGEAKEPLPHLFLISDEFAELKKEQPEFMSELISTARIGRSLGVHLILATQKPSGVVDDQIWSNSKFKLALKVQNEADSKEILKTPDAANITQPGRAYLQVGNNEIYELFQSAWSGAIYSEDCDEEKVDDRVYVVNELGQGELVNQDLSGSQKNSNCMTTQLDIVVKYIHDYYKSIKKMEVQKPWLPPLSEQLVSPQECIDGTGRAINLTAQLGMIDIPEKQLQEPYIVDFVRDGNLLYIASSGYGKTVFLTTVILSLAMHNSVENLNFYILDFGNSGLIPLNKLHHTADYITFEDTERMEKLILLIENEVKERKKKLAEKMVQNFEVYNQVAEDKMKAIFLVVDNFDVVNEMGFGQDEFFKKITRDGYGLGIFVVATATRSNSMKYSIYNNFKNKVAGYLFDESDANVIVGKSPYKQSEIKGRCLIKYQDMVSTMQIYSMVAFQNDVEYNRQIDVLIQRIISFYPNRKAPRIPVLPENLFYSDMDNYEKTGKDIYIGLDKEVVCGCGFCIENTPFTILGEAVRGKTNAIKVILAQIIGTGPIYIVDSKSMELYPYKAEDSITYIENSDMVVAFMNVLKREIEVRNQKVYEMMQENAMLSPKEICAQMTPFYLVVDDWDNFVEMTSAQAMKLAPMLNEAVGVGISIILSANSGKMRGFDEVTKFAKNTTEGLLLGGQGTTGMFQVNSNRELPQFMDGLLFHMGSYVRVRVPKYE